MTEQNKSGWMDAHERRQVRLRVLLGQGAADIARALGRDRTTIVRQIKKYELDAPPETLEAVRLELELSYEAMALAGLSAPLSAAERTIMLKMSSELRQLERRAAREAAELARAQAAEEATEITGEQGDGIDWDADGLWSRETCERVLGHALGVPEAGRTRGGVELKGAAVTTDDRSASSVCDVGAPGAIAAKERLADMVVHGRTWRWKDAGGGRVGALGGDVRTYWPCGPGWPGPI